MNLLIIICLILLFWMYTMCKRSPQNSPQNSPNNNRKSNFNNFKTEETTDIGDKKNNIDLDTVLIFHAKWCGHCKKSLPDFKEAVSQSDNIILIDSDEEPALVKKYNVKGFPTIMKGSGEIYSGERDSDSILKFSKS